MTKINNQILEKLPKEVIKIFDIFEDKIRLVGGSVRDLMLDKTINDFDFATPLLPTQVQKILNQNNLKSIPTGIKYGTITTVMGDFNFQITTLRIDHNQQGRTCDVNFTDNFLEDAQRRDFTINALYLDKTGKIYDYFNGVSDLTNQIVRFIGDAESRISEDYLRILRFFRFSCNYALEFDKKGLDSSIKNQKFLANISKERIREEFCKILSSQNQKKILKTIKIFDEFNFTKTLWETSIDYLAFENLINHSNYKNIKITTKIATLFFTQNFDLKEFCNNFKCTNIEKKFLQKMLNYLRPNGCWDFLYQNLAKEKINQILTLENKDFAKDFTIEYCLIIFSKNYLKNSTKNNYSNKQNDLENIINYIINLDVPNFNITIADLESINCPKNKLNKLFKALKAFWAKNNFLINHKDLLNEGQRILSNNLIDIT